MPVKIKKRPKKKPFKKWYDDNKADFNEQRRERYKNDPNYREKVRLENAKKSKRKPKPRKPFDSFEVVTLNLHGRKTLECYSIKDACTLIGRGLQTIRLWIKNKDIPTGFIQDDKRNKYYTVNQVKLLCTFADIRRGLSGAKLDAEQDLKEASKIVFHNWEK